MKFSSFHPNVRIRIVLAFIGSLFFNLVIPFMTVYLSGKMNPGWVALGLGLGVGVSLVAGMYGGYLSDRIGRKRIMLLAEGVMVLCFGTMALTNSPWLDSPLITLIMVVLVNAAWGFFDPAASAMMLDVTTPEMRKFMYGYFYWCNNLAIAIGGAIGGLLFSDYVFELLLLLTAGGIVQFAVTMWKITETKQTVPATTSSSDTTGLGGIGSMIRSYAAVMKDNLFTLYILASTLLVSTEFHLTGYIGIRLSEEIKDTSLFTWFGQNVHVNGYQMLGVLRTENTILVVLFSLFIGTIMRKFKDKPVLYTGFFMYILGNAYLMFGSAPMALLAVMFVVTLGEVMYVPVKQAYLGNIVPDHARSSYMFVHGLTYKGAMLIAAGAVAMGSVLPSWVMALSVAVTGFAGLYILYRIMPRIEARMDGLTGPEAPSSNPPAASAAAPAATT